MKFNIHTKHALAANIVKACGTRILQSCHISLAFTHNILPDIWKITEFFKTIFRNIVQFVGLNQSERNRN
jgi:hypothetical protein